MDLRHPPASVRVDRFTEAFGAPPTHVAFAPGRVNLIGDHTDYNGLPVLPMALQRRVELVLRARPDAVVRVANADPAAERGTFLLSEPLERGRPGHWLNYVKAGAGAVQTLAAERGVAPVGVDAWVTSDVPVAAGLSSSSALVVATMLALLHTNRITCARAELMARAARAERFVGTEGGGMDQAISLGGRAGHALRIDFEPLTLHAIPIPDTWRFVVAHSGERAEKSGEAQAVYNARVRACADGLAALTATWTSAERTDLGVDGGAGVTYARLLARPDLAPVARAETRLDGPTLRCVRHTLTEAQRVLAAAAALARGDAEDFGAAMDASHASLADDYGVSTPRLDALVTEARRAGAHGARLTGAGLGGSMVALTDEHTEESVRAALLRRLRDFAVEDPVVFTAVASDGARVDALL